MGKLRRFLCLVLTLTMVVATLIGCGSEGGKEKKETTIKGEEKKGKQEKIKLRFACWDYETTGYNKATVEAFEAAHPDIEVEVIDIPAKEYSEKLTVMLSAGEDIDVFLGKSPESIGGIILRDQALAIDEYVKKENYNTKPYGNVLNEVIMNDKLYGLPYRSDFWLLYYNKDIFDKANVAYPTNDWTWEEFRETAKILTSGEGNDKTYGAYIQSWASPYFLMGLQKGEGNLVEGNYSMLKDGLDLLVDIQMNDKSAADYATNKSMGAHYKGINEQGKVGMLYMGTWHIGQLVKDKKDGLHNINWGIAQMPTWKGYEDATIGNVTPVMIHSTTDHPDAAWEMAKFIGGKEGASILAERLMMPGYRDDGVLEIINNNEDIPEGAKDGLSTNKVYMEWPAHKLTGLLDKMVDEEISLVATGNKSVDDAIADMEARRKEIVEQNK